MNGMSKGTARRLSLLLAHRDAEWVDQAKQRLVTMGYDVTDCLEPDWVADLLGGSRPFNLAAVSSELDPAVQADVLRVLKNRSQPPKLVLLLDSLDSATVNFRADGPILTHRLTEKIEDFVRLVVDQVGIPDRPRT